MLSVIKSAPFFCYSFNCKVLNVLWACLIVSNIGYGQLPAENRKSFTLLLKNNADIQLKDKDIRISRTALLPLSGELYPVLTSDSGIIIPSQTEDLDNDGKWDELFFVIDLGAKEKKKIISNWTTEKPVYAPRSAIRFGKRRSATAPVFPLVKDTFYPENLPTRIGYEPYQTDGPTWENDKVGFRHYFDGRNSKDLFGKRVKWMSPKNVGLTTEGAVEDNYHVLRDWGRDILPVANSVGIGGIGLLINGKLNRIGGVATDTVHNVESTDFNVISNGPLKSSFSLHYNNWKSDGGTIYQVSENPVIWPGMYAYKNTIAVSGVKGNEQLIVGLSKVATDHPLKELKLKNWVVLYTHDYQSYNKEFIIGLAIILPSDSYLGFDKSPLSGSLSSSYYAKLKLSDLSPVTYYAAGCWELADAGFKDETYFQSYLKSLIDQINARVTVRIAN